MKILLAVYQEAVTNPEKQKNLHGPHVLRPLHVAQVTKAAKGARIAVTSTSRDAEREVRDTDIVAGFPVTLPPLSHAPKLKWIHSFSAGMDQVLTQELVASSVLASNSSGIHRVPIAEHVMGFLLMFTRGFVRAFRNQEQKLWEKDTGITELSGKTLLIVGLGNIGSEVARLAHAFGMRVTAVSEQTAQQSKFVHVIKKPSSLNSLLPGADFVVSALPHTRETHHHFDYRVFRLMKSSAVFINIGRGGLVHEKDLIKALQKKIIAGTALDVTEIEPLPKESPLWNMPNVIITPHQSGLSEKYMDRAIEQFCANLKAFLAHKPLPNLVDKKRGY